MKFSFNTIVAPTYKGRDYNYYIQPLKEYGAAYKEVEKEYADLIAQTEAWKVKANQEENPIAYDMYNRYSAMLSEASANFSRGMTQTNRRALLGLKKNYAQEIVPIAEAAKALDAANAEIAKNGSDAIYHKSGPLKIDDFLHGAKPNTKYSSAKGITAKVTAGMTSLKAAYKGVPTLTKGTRGKDLESSGFTGLTPEDRQFLDNITPDNYENNPWLQVQSTNDKNQPNINLRRAAAKFKVDTLKAEGWDDMDDEAKKKALNAANQGLLAVMETPDSKYVASSAATEWSNSINATKAAHNYELYKKSEYYEKVPYEVWEKMFFKDLDDSSTSSGTKVSKGTQDSILANYDKLKSGDRSTTMVSLDTKGSHGGEIVVDNSTPSAPKKYEIYTDANGERQVVVISGKVKKTEDSVVDDETNMRNAVQKDTTFEIINGEAKKVDVKAGVPLVKGNGVSISIRGYQGDKPFITKQDVVDAFERSYKIANDDLPEDFNQPGSDSEEKINNAYLNITKAISGYYGEGKKERPNINNSIQIGWDDSEETIKSFRIVGASNNPVAQKQNPVNAIQIDQTKSKSIQSGIDQLQLLIDSPYESDAVKEKAIAKRDELKAVLSDVVDAENKKLKEEADRKKVKEQQAKREAEIKAQKEEHNKKVALAKFVKDAPPIILKKGDKAFESNDNYELAKNISVYPRLAEDSTSFDMTSSNVHIDQGLNLTDTANYKNRILYLLKTNENVDKYLKQGIIIDKRPDQSVIKTKQGKVILRNLNLGKDPEKAQTNVRLVLASKQAAEAQANALSKKYQNNQGQELLKAIKSKIETANSKVDVSQVQLLYEQALDDLKTLELQLEAEKSAKKQKADSLRPVQGVQVQTQGSVRMNTTQQEIDAIVKQAMSN